MSSLASLGFMKGRMPYPEHDSPPVMFSDLGAEKLKPVSVDVEDEIGSIANACLETMTAEDLKRLRTYNVAFGLPSFGGQMFTTFHDSMMQLARVMDRLGIRFKEMILSTESLIGRGRCTIASNVLAGPYTHLMFIDVDIGFDPRSVIRMLIMDVPVVGGAYPFKTISKLEMVRLAWSLGKSGHPIPDEVTAEKIAAATQPIVLNGLGKPDKNGICMTRQMPTGFLMIQKGVLARLSKHVKSYHCNLGWIGEAPIHYEFFPTAIDPENQVMMSEDYAFCELCHTYNIPVLCDTTIALTHSGPCTFQGSVEAVTRLGAEFEKMLSSPPA